MRVIRVLSFLAWELSTLLLRKIWRILTNQKRGEELFLQNYQADKLWALTPTQRTHMQEIQGCTQCGLCEFITQHPQQQLMQTRTLTDIDLPHQTHNPETQQQLQEICPAKLSFHTPNSND